jgi:L-threonylcarbamoyladenylate synthase
VRAYCSDGSPKVPNRNSIDDQISLAIDILRHGGLVAFPTDTVYGLGCDPFNARAVEELYRVKDRKRTLPLPLLLADVSDIGRVAVAVPEAAWRLAERLLPGALTLVLNKSAQIPRSVTAGGETVALRVPDHHVPRELARRLGGPVAGTSANISGTPSPLNHEQVRAQLEGRVNLIIEGGACPIGIESSVVDLSAGAFRLVREGAIPREEIERAIRPGCPET